jgi:hypothetical protein
VLSDDSYLDYSAWTTMDCCVCTWIYGTASNDLQQSLILRDHGARAAWLYHGDEFIGQRESRAQLLEAEFCTFKQGALSTTDYCHRLEMMAASLTELGDPIGDQQLILTLFRGLNGKFHHMVSNLKMQWMLPKFDGARMLLLLEEIDLNDIMDDGPPAAPLAFVVGPLPPPPCPTAPAPTSFGAPSRSRNSR